jgi:hypothetical protein
MRALWPRWTLVPPLPFVLWPLYCFSRGEMGRVELWVMALLGGVLPYINHRTKKLFVGIYPLMLVGPLYDSMRFIQNLGITPERVHLCDLRAHEIALFGITYKGQPATLHDWLQDHHTTALDILFSIPYGTFIEAAVAAGIYLYIKDYAAMRRFTLAFFLLNVAGFTTYHLYPAAPPWWFHAHGCFVDLAGPPSEGPNLARVDALLGIRYFGGFYGRSHDIFGAVPSLHVAYPLLITLEGWKSFSKILRACSVTFFVLMCCAAVYLDHHWVIDVCLGLLYTVIVVTLLRWIDRRRASFTLPGPPSPSTTEAAV